MFDLRVGCVKVRDTVYLQYRAAPNRFYDQMKQQTFDDMSIEDKAYLGASRNMYLYS